MTEFTASISYICVSFRSPAMVGGLFAIHRHYFNEIGQYDKGMNLWGGENLELSLRVIKDFVF